MSRLVKKLARISLVEGMAGSKWNGRQQQME